MPRARAPNYTMAFQARTPEVCNLEDSDALDPRSYLHSDQHQGKDADLTVRREPMTASGGGFN